jgi:MFS family permease
MLFFGIMGIIITTLIWGFTRNRPNANHAKPHVLTGLKYILKNSQIWLLAIYGGLMFMSISILGSLWGTPFLMAKYQITNTAASANLSSLFIGLGIGCPLLCWISDHFERRKIIMFIASFGTLISIIPVLYFAIPYWLTAVLLCGLGFFMGGFLVSFNLAREVQSTGAAMGFMNTINMVGGALMQSVCGLIMDLMHPNSIAKGQKIYTLLDFQVALSIVPLTTIIALIMLYWINERN